MNIVQFNQLVLAAAVALGSSASFAQDAMKPAPMSKKDMTMQECKDHMSTAKGEKRNDTPANAETERACADMMKKGDGKMMKKDGAPKKESGVTQEQPTK